MEELSEQQQQQLRLQLLIQLNFSLFFLLLKTHSDVIYTERGEGILFSYSYSRDIQEGRQGNANHADMSIDFNYAIYLLTYSLTYLAAPCVYFSVEQGIFTVLISSFDP